MEQRTICPPRCPRVFSAFHYVCRSNSYLKNHDSGDIVLEGFGLWPFCLCMLLWVQFVGGPAVPYFHADAGWLWVITVVPVAQNEPMAEEW